MFREKIFEEISKERDYQNSKWGTEFDDKNTLNDWVSYMNIYLGQASKIDSNPTEQERQLLKAVTIGVAALETLYRNGKFADRHYENIVPK